MLLIIGLIILIRRIKKYEKKIKIEIRHGGNQEIPEFYSYTGKQSITFEISEESTIGEVKDEIGKQVKYVDRLSLLFTAPFGKKLPNIKNIKEVQSDQGKSSETLILFIVIPNY